MDEYKAVASSLSISRSITDTLEQAAPQMYNGSNRSSTIWNINDILQGRSEKTVDTLIAALRVIAEPYHSADMERHTHAIQDFRAQKALLSVPYTKSSSKAYQYRTFDMDPHHPLKIINQRIFDQAAKAGFPPGFFRESYFDHVTIYCMPDGTDLNFSRFQDCTFSVCRIHNALFDGTVIDSSEFHSCEIEHTTYFQAGIAHTHFYDSTLRHVSFQSARLKSCNTINCALDRVCYLHATLDGCSFGKVTPTEIRDLDTAKITMGGATNDECKKNRESIYKTLHVPIPPTHRRAKGPNIPTR